MRKRIFIGKHEEHTQAPPSIKKGKINTKPQKIVYRMVVLYLKRIGKGIEKLNLQILPILIKRQIKSTNINTGKTDGWWLTHFCFCIDM